MTAPDPEAGLPPIPPPPATDSPAGAHVDPTGDAAGPSSGEQDEPPERANPRARSKRHPMHTFVSQVRRHWARIPLRMRLLTVISVLLIVGLSTVGAITTVMFERHLKDQLDSRLRDNAAGIISRDGLSFGSRMLPTDYCFAIVDSSVLRNASYYCNTTTIAKNGIPFLANAPTSHTSLTEAFTVKGIAPPNSDIVPTESEPTWRVIGIPLANETTAGVPDMVYIALPLTYTKQTANQVRVAFMLATLAVALSGAMVGYVAVRESLKPLRRIEATASRIAQGDLSARVPDMPPTTEVGSLARSLNTMLAQIEVAFAARASSEARMRQFVSDASHELRTPLATIRGYGELYRMGALNDKAELDDTMRRIDDSSRRMASLVEDLLALARLDEGRELRRDPVDLVALARDGAMDLGALDAERRVALVHLDGAAMDIIDADGKPGKCVVIGDEDRLRQVVMNLVGNVARHTPTSTPVEIAVGAREGFGVFSVIDHGPGVAEDQVARLFERFYRADSSRDGDRVAQGSGSPSSLPSPTHSVATHASSKRRAAGLP